MSGNRYVTIEYDAYVRESQKAALLIINGQSVWIPFSQLEDENEKFNQVGGSVSVTRWIADQNELEYDE